jgi:hypothetical protein
MLSARARLAILGTFVFVLGIYELRPALHWFSSGAQSLAPAEAEQRWN